MKIEPAKNLGNSCTYLDLEPDSRVCYQPMPVGVTVWDLSAEKEYFLTWILRVDVNFRAQKQKPTHIEISERPVPEKYKAMFADKSLALRGFYASPDEKETIESELDYRRSVGESVGLDRNIRPLDIDVRRKRLTTL